MFHTNHPISRLLHEHWNKYVMCTSSRVAHLCRQPVNYQSTWPRTKKKVCERSVLGCVASVNAKFKQYGESFTTQRDACSCTPKCEFRSLPSHDEKPGKTSLPATAMPCARRSSRLSARTCRPRKAGAEDLPIRMFNQHTIFLASRRSR